MMNGLYDTTLLESNIQERLIKNYGIAAERAKVGYTGSACYWTKQTLAEIIMEALPFSKLVNEDMYKALYNLYLKVSV